MQNFKNNACLRCCWWCKIGVKMVHLPQQQGPLLEISYIPLFSVMTLQISILEDMKQLCRSHLSSTGIPTPKLIIKPDLF